MEPSNRPTTQPWDPPALPPVQTSPVRVSGPGLGRIGIFVGGCLVLLAAAAVALGAPARGTTIDPVADPGWSMAGAPSLHGGVFGGRGLRGGVHGGITITAISGPNLSLATDNGWTRTIDASGATITRDGATIQLSELQVGDNIGLREQRNADGTYTITRIAVLPDRVAGVVSEVGDSTFTVRLADGSTLTIAITSSTTYSLGREATTKDALRVGLQVVAAGTEDGGTFTATRVHLAQAFVAGIVTAKNGSTLTIAIGDGTTRTVNVSGSTTYQVRGVENAGLDDIAVNSAVVARGTLNADGSLDATAVASGLGRGFGFGFGGGGKGHGPLGGIFGGGDAPAPDAAPGDGSTDGTS